MTKFTYEETQDFDKMLEAYPCLDKCFCGGIIEMSLEHIMVYVSSKTMELSEIPMLKCKKCDKIRFSEYAKEIIWGLHKELLRRGDVGVESRPNGYRKKYTETNFDYDHRDYESIPGLKYDEEHSEPGFLKCVFSVRKLHVCPAYSGLAIIFATVDEFHSLRYFSSPHWWSPTPN